MGKLIKNIPKNKSYSWEYYRGAAGIRTLVRTKHRRTFYMLSFYSDFRNQVGIKAATPSSYLQLISDYCQSTQSSLPEIFKSLRYVSGIKCND